jgi:DNA-binding NtrC family response regulator
MRELFEMLRRAAASDATVLLTGETGTGKEVSARAIHDHGARRDKPFVVVDCGAIPGQLLESELFGYERGAFTGAVSSRAGAFEVADGGTVFLDEIGELQLELQPKLLRVLESRAIKRVGGNSYFGVDVRVIAATHRSLSEEVRSGRFREDLYYRCAVLRVRLPALREHKQDLPALVDSILSQLGVEPGGDDDPRRDPLFLQAIADHHWPGNVRQLRNYLERCVAMGGVSAPPGTDSTLPPPPLESAPSVKLPLPSQLPDIDVSESFKDARERWNAHFETAYLRRVLEEHGHNVTAAARAAQVNRAHFYRLLAKHGLRDREK